MMVVWVALGGIFGSWARFWLGRWSATHWSQSFPLGTAIINGSGAFLLGVSLGAGLGSQPAVRWFWEVGFLGSYTTFSTFGYEVVSLFHDREFGKAAGYLAGSGFFGVLLAWLGYRLGGLMA